LRAGREQQNKRQPNAENDVLMHNLPP